MQDRFETIGAGQPQVVALLLAQILDEPYPRVNRKRTASTAGLDSQSSQDKEGDYSNTNRTVPFPSYRNIAYASPLK